MDRLPNRNKLFSVSQFRSRLGQNLRPASRQMVWQAGADTPPKVTAARRSSCKQLEQPEDRTIMNVALLKTMAIQTLYNTVPEGHEAVLEELLHRLLQALADEIRTSCWTLLRFQKPTPSPMSSVNPAVPSLPTGVPFGTPPGLGVWPDGNVDQRKSFPPRRTASLEEISAWAMNAEAPEFVPSARVVEPAEEPPSSDIARTSTQMS